MFFHPQEMQDTKYRIQLSLIARCLPARALKAATTAAAHGRTGYQAGLVEMQACPLMVGSPPAVLRSVTVLEAAAALRTASAAQEA